MHFDPSILYEAPAGAENKQSTQQTKTQTDPFNNPNDPNMSPNAFDSAASAGGDMGMGGTDPNAMGAGGFGGMNTFGSGNMALPPEQEDNQTILIRLIHICKNFDTIFRKFEMLFPECPMNNIVENRLIVIKKMLKYILDHKQDRERILDAYKIIVSFITITDDHLTKYVKFKMKLKKHQEHQKSVQKENKENE